MIRKNMTPVALACGMALLLNQVVALSQGSRNQTDTIDTVTRTQVIQEVLVKLDENYIFPQVAKDLEKAIQAKQQKGEYDSITSGDALAAVLTAQLRELSHDQHLKVSYAPPPPVSVPDDPVTRKQSRDSFIREAEMENFGFSEAKMLDGGIGYLDVRDFYQPSLATETLSAAMSFLANSNALIIDLRNNGGGHTDTPPLFLSYFFDKPVQLTSIVWREGNRIEEHWTNANVPGKRFGENKPVYVLTSKATFSAAEGIAYDLQSFKRAVIVGEITRGGANPGDFFRLSGNFRMFIPTGRTVNPRTNSNWEMVGVKPDVQCSERLAMKTAHLLALQKVIATSADPGLRSDLEKPLAKAQKELADLKKSLSI